MARRDDRLDEELLFHLEQQIAKHVRQGMTPEDARRRALLKLGGVEQTREAARDEFRGAWIADFVRDLRIGVRTLGRVPSFALTAVLTFALGVGAATAMFSVFDGVLLRPLPYPESDRIVRLFQLRDNGARGGVSDPNFDDWRDGTRGFGSMAQMSNYGPVPIAGAGPAQLARLTLVSKQFFDVMGVVPALGRGFHPDEQRPGAAPVAIVSAAFWRQWRGEAAPKGEVIRSGPVSYTVVGVMPDGFDYPAQTAIWAPREMYPPYRSRTAHNSQVVARLADGIPLEQAQAEISALSRRLKEVHKDGTWMFDAQAVPLLEVVTATSKATLQLLFAASVLLLLVACTNVSNLLVARAASRRAEFALQLAIGATPGRIGRQLLAETTVLCLAGAALGVAAAVAAVRMFVAMGPASVQRLDTVSVSWSAVAVAIAISTAAALVRSLVTALGARSVRISDALSDQSRSRTGSRRQMRAREGLIVTQMALTLVLLASAALLGRSLHSVVSIDPGYSLDEGLIVGLTVPGDGSVASQVRQVALQQTVIDRLRAQPGVTAVGLISAFPLGEGSRPDGTFIEMTRPDEITTPAQFDLTNPQIKQRSGSAQYRQVSGDYFKAMRIPLLQGRLIDDRDTPASPHVAVISQSLAESRWPNRSPLGRWIQFGNMDGDLRAITIVGVVGDVREATPEAPPQPMLYVSARQRPRQATRADIIVRGPEPSSLIEPARRIVREADPDVPATLRTVSGALDTAVGARRFTLWLVGAFGLAALVLATLGVYGLMAFYVSQRMREMGVRMALGAEPRSLVWLIVRRGAALTITGALAGVVVARAASGSLEGLLYGVTAGDPATIAGAVVLVLIVSALASFAPGLRILRQSPSITLREGV
jgi:putative ABC transport system permease protein